MDRKAELVEKLGVDRLYFVEFGQAFAQLKLKSLLINI